MQNEDLEMTHILIASDGDWGRGITVAEAVENAKHIKSGAKVMTAPCTAKTHIDQDGRVYGRIGTWMHGVVRGGRAGMQFIPNKVQP